MKKILIVEDEPNLADGLQMNLNAEGYDTIIAADGPAALEVFRCVEFDLALVDVMLPGMDGFSLCKEFRKSSQLPIIFLTARDQDRDKVEGLKLGADDYITKPFNLEELLQRISAIFRRMSWDSAPPEENRILSFSGCQVDLETLKARGPGGETSLTQREAKVIKYLYERRGKAVSRDMLLDGVWGYHSYPSTRTVDNFILRLRKIFETDPASPKVIKSVRGIGYLLDV